MKSKTHRYYKSKKLRKTRYNKEFKKYLGGRSRRYKSKKLYGGAAVAQEQSQLEKELLKALQKKGKTKDMLNDKALALLAKIKQYEDKQVSAEQPVDQFFSMQMKNFSFMFDEWIPIRCVLYSKHEDYNIFAWRCPSRRQMHGILVDPRARHGQVTDFISTTKRSMRSSKYEQKKNRLGVIANTPYGEERLELSAYSSEDPDTLMGLINQRAVVDAEEQRITKINEEYNNYMNYMEEFFNISSYAEQYWEIYWRISPDEQELFWFFAKLLIDKSARRHLESTRLYN